jgi:hypothetical protein
MQENQIPYPFTGEPVTFKKQNWVKSIPRNTPFEGSESVIFCPCEPVFFAIWSHGHMIKWRMEILLVMDVGS